MRNRSASKTVPGLLLLSLAALLPAQPAAALDADYWRGGWRTPLGDEPHIYEFVIRGQRVTGVYCRNCSDATTIGFIDGTWDEKAGIDFTVTFASPDGKIRSVDKQHAMLADGRLIVTGSAGRRNGSTLTLVKDPRGADPGGAPAYHLPPGTPPALPDASRGRRWRRRWLRSARALLAAGAIQGVTAGGHRRHVDRPVRPGHGQADLHLSPGRRPAPRRGVRPLRQHLHDWGDGERLHRRRYPVFRHRARGLGRERPADLQAEYRRPGRAERDDRRHSREEPRDRSCQSTRAAGGTRLHARRADCSRGDEREQLRGYRRLGTRYGLRHPAAARQDADPAGGPGR